MTEERFWAKVDRSTLDGCWVWTGTRHHESGYGRFYTEGTSRQAHRVSYELTIGPIPPGLVIDHLCRNPACVNPGHLEAVTHRENVRRGDFPKVAGRFQRSKTHCAHDHEFTPENTLVVPDGSRQCRECNRARQRRERAARKALKEAKAP